MMGTGYIIAESRMISGTNVMVNSPNMEDPVLLDLLQSNDCCDAVYNHWLEIPQDQSLPCNDSAAHDLVVIRP
jgi:hypothetical protein